MDSVSLDFLLLSRDFFRAVSPGRIPKPLLTYNFFRPQAADAVKYNICSPLEASGPAPDEARSSSATHPSQSCSPQQPMETFARNKQSSIYTPFRAEGFATQHSPFLGFCNPTFLWGLRFCNPTLLLGLLFCNPTLPIGLSVLQPNAPFGNSHSSRHGKVHVGTLGCTTARVARVSS